MEQFNRDVYKKESLAQQFFGSCLGKIVTLGLLMVVLMVIAIITVPTDSMVKWQMEDNIRELLQDNDGIKGDDIDQAIDNFSNIFTHADTTANDKEIMKVYHKYNKLQVHHHTLFSTARVYNNLHPDGVRVGIGVFTGVIPTVKTSDLLLDVGPVRGDYNKKLVPEEGIPDQDMGENPNLKPYHYQGNPDD